MPNVLLAAAIGVALAAVVAVAIAVRRARRLEARLTAFLEGRDGQSLESLLAALTQESKKHAGYLAELRQASEYLHGALQAAIRKVAFERYNPFPGLGSNQSFTLVLLDAGNHGVILTSLHNRESTRVYAKSVRDGKPLQQLSAEEERALQTAVLQQGA